MLTEIDIKRLPSYAIGFEAGEGEARGRATENQAIARRLLLRFDAAQVADLLGVGVDEVERMAGGAGSSTE
jgi:hypothetical protein